MKIALALGTLLLMGCQPIVIEVKPRTVNVESTTQVGGAMDCRDHVLPSGSVELEAMLKEAGLDLSQGCLKALSFGLLGEIALSGTASCAMPRGTGTLESVRVDLVCADGSTRTLTQVCPQTSFDFSDAWGTQQSFNACLDLAETELSEPLRKATNECRPKKLTAVPVGSCSADACFAATLKMGFRLNSATAQLGGSCP